MSIARVIRSPRRMLLPLALLALAAGCTVPPPPGASPLRYRDVIVANVRVTSGIVHGGGFVAGDSTNSAMVRMANAFARRGYVAASINYRLLGDGDCARENPPSQACFDAAIAAQHDAQAAVRWFRAHAGTYGVDPTRVAIGGGSAGAVTALA